MISWNSQMALDARQHLFLSEAAPERIWRVQNSEGKQFVLKLYRVNREMDAVRAGHYVESKHLPTDENDYDPRTPEAGTEWAYVEGSVDSFLAHYTEVQELEAPSSP